MIASWFFHSDSPYSSVHQRPKKAQPQHQPHDPTNVSCHLPEPMIQRPPTHAKRYQHRANHNLVSAHTHPPDCTATAAKPFAAVIIFAQSTTQGSNVAGSALRTFDFEGHSFNNSATCVTSLSPRPLKLTMIVERLPSCRACFITYAIACADSKAGMIPSAREQN